MGFFRLKLFFVKILFFKIHPLSRLKRALDQIQINDTKNDIALLLM